MLLEWLLKPLHWLGLKEPVGQTTLDPLDPEVTVEPLYTHTTQYNEVAWPTSRFAVLGLLSGASIWWLIVLSRSPGLGSVAVATIVTLVVTLVILRIVRGPVETLVDDIVKPTTISKRTRQALGQREVVLWEDREHPIGLLKWWIALVLIQPITIITAIYVSLGGALILWTLVMTAIAIRLYVWDINRISLTDKRILVVKGLFETDQEGVMLTKLSENAARINRASTILGFLRIIDRHYATLRFESSGGNKDRGIEMVVYIRNGHAVNRYITGIMLHGYQPPEPEPEQQEPYTY